MFNLFRSSPTPTVNFHNLVENGAKLIDVRNVNEYRAGHIPGSINIPLRELQNRMDELDSPSDDVVVHCQSGGRSANAAGFLRRSGFSAVHDLGSIRNW